MGSLQAGRGLAGLLVMWSEETERLRERYHVLYGLTQGLCIAGVVSSLLYRDEGGWRQWAMVGLCWPAAIVWRRWGWRPYQRAYRADLDARVERARVECHEALSRPPGS